MKRTSSSSKTFIWRICAAHVIAYFLAGLFALSLLDYRTHFASKSLSGFMKPVDSPWVALGPGLQIFRGVLLGAILLPLRTWILDKKGFIKLGWLVFGLGFLSTIGPTPGSFDGYIYTLLPLQYHLGGIPEALLYTLLFCGTLALWYKTEKSYVSIIAGVLVGTVLLCSVAGFLQTVVAV